jgi:hypothetical protein
MAKLPIFIGKILERNGNGSLLGYPHDTNQLEVHIIGLEARRDMLVGSTMHFFPT